MSWDSESMSVGGASGGDDAEAVLGSLDREVWVVTSGDDEGRGGLLATWVMQTSLDPARPAILLGMGPNHHTADVIERTGLAAAHLLRPEQTSLGLRFATSSGWQEDKLWGLELLEHPASLPILQDCHGWLAGAVFAKLNAGDRTFFLDTSGAGKPTYGDRPSAAAVANVRRRVA